MVKVPLFYSLTICLTFVCLVPVCLFVVVVDDVIADVSICSQYLVNCTSSVLRSGYEIDKTSGLNPDLPRLSKSTKQEETGYKRNT